MARQIVLDRITLPVPDERFIELAAGAGYTAVSLWTAQPDPALQIAAIQQGTPRFREIRHALAANGLLVAGCEFLMIVDAPPTDLDRLAIASCAALGARFLTATFFDPIDLPTAARRLAERADIAAEYGIDLTIEFMAPAIARGVCSLAEANRIVALAERPNIGITADMLHLTRCATAIDDLTATPAQRFRYIQLCDGPLTMPADRQLWEAGCGRLLPGAGEFPIRQYLAALPADVPVGMECPNGGTAPERLAIDSFRSAHAWLD